MKRIIYTDAAENAIIITFEGNNQKEVDDIIWRAVMKEDEITDIEKIKSKKIRGTNPNSYRTGIWSELLGSCMFISGLEKPKPAPRKCYICLYEDGIIDFIAARDEMNYEIKSK